MKNLNYTSTFSEDILPSASGVCALGTAEKAFSSGNFVDIRGDIAYVSDLTCGRVFPSGIRVGADQATAGAGPGEIWADSDDGYTIKLGQ